ncbi:hypothetical protein GCM10010260_83120 [Streptomyces filipinensis]|uniref:Helix-turn-helix domain-containing protein n=1 Tax=Streptomyces filipinensis TaxID=66887 RepID=A0A918IKF5_9ACTN|nr:helix-turn-helix domain-containing protein [Streptomyces filipinensis]GGV29931.1 hypothetical protein GCM10010260_83120 [Streptomyces filipinensis]
MRAVRTAPVGSPGAALGSMLENLRQQAQLTFADLAERTAALGDPALAVSAATLKRAAGGHTLPKETTVVAYVRGCGATPQQEHNALQLRKRARAKDRGILRQLHAPGVHSIRTRQDFTAALAAVYEDAGAPPLRTVQLRAGTVAQPDGVPSECEVFLLPLGTLCRIVNRKVKLPAWNHCEAFLRGCGITGQRTLQQWKQAWSRASTAPATATAAQELHEEEWNALRRRAALRRLLRMTAAPASGPASPDQGPAVRADDQRWRRLIELLPPTAFEEVVVRGVQTYLTSEAARNGKSTNGLTPWQPDMAVVHDGRYTVFEAKSASGRNDGPQAGGGSVRAPRAPVGGSGPSARVQQGSVPLMPALTAAYRPRRSTTATS